MLQGKGGGFWEFFVSIGFNGIFYNRNELDSSRVQVAPVCRYRF